MRTVALCLHLLFLSQSFAQSVSFESEVAPILKARCIRCHSGEHPKGDLDLSTEKGLQQGGSSGKVVSESREQPGLLWEMVEQKRMPPKEQLSDNELRILKNWLEKGSPWRGPALQVASKPTVSLRAGKDWWSLQPINKVSLPTVKQQAWIRNEIDHFILHQLESRGLSPSAEADRRTYIRRVTFDITGLPPTPSEIDAFVRDTSDQAYETLVDRLLASPRYGERWGRHWLDVVRFAESHGYETNELRRNAWPYRDWVIRALNEDKPFDRFVQEQLAGDVVAAGDLANEVATGFLVGGTHDVVGNQTPEGMAQQRQDDLYDMVSTTGSAFLGLTLNCARCHDHKFDPISQKEYYSMQSFFAGVQHGARDVANPAVKLQLDKLMTERKSLNQHLMEYKKLVSNSGPPNSVLNTEVFDAVQARFVRMTINKTKINDEPCIDEFEIYAGDINVAHVSMRAKPTASSEYPNSDIHRIVHLNDGLPGNSKSWISNEPGKGWLQIEWPTPVVIDRIVWGRDRNNQFQDRLAVKYQLESSLDGSNWKLLCTEADRMKRPVAKDQQQQSYEMKSHEAKLASLNTKIRDMESQLQVYCGVFKKAEPVHLLKRGDPMMKQEEVPPSSIEALGIPISIQKNATDQQRRLALANWIADRRNPLPARVMVNRVWHYHFGTGIVNTPSDFGFNGGKPSHPELLDWLAYQFHENQGRLKPLHRMIVLSATYRQSSQPDQAAVARNSSIDADNRLLWKAPRRRLEAEAIRDTILSVSGNLDLTMGGPGYDLWKYSNYVVVFEQQKMLPANAYRRMVYQFKPRTQQDSTFGSFDCPDGTLTMPKRNSSTTALQALNLLNSPFMIQQSSILAGRLKKKAGMQSEAQMKLAFRLALGRLPTPKEEAICLAIIHEHGLEAFCRALLNSNEFIYID
ncbi:MAG: DUF1549 domain-containing protein [Planctomycetia bacterium]|nr:DUF1549 domain-containing protein [Planctomycetia bacterium]